MADCNNDRKGQAVPLDFMAGLFIFLVMLAYFLILWDIFSVRYIEQAQEDGLEAEAITLSEQLVSSGGHPQNWTASPLSAQSIGLAKAKNELDWYRVDALSSLPYANARQLLGIDRDFLIKIETPEGARYATIGQQAGNTIRVVEVTRVATLNGSIVNVRVQLYE